MTDRSPAAVVRDAIPGYRAAEAAVAAIRDRADDNRRALLTPAPDLAAQVVDAAVRGEPIPGDLGERHLAAGQRAAIIAAEREVLNRAEAQAASRRDEALRQGADHGIRALGDLLADVLDTARRAARDLDGITTADEAIRAGHAQSWQALGDAAQRYRQIRNEQASLYRATGGHVNVNGSAVDYRSVFDLAGHVANLDDVWPDWLAWHRDRDGDPVWPEGDDREYLRWLVTHPAARPWVPSAAELGAAFGEQQRASQARERAAEEESTHGRPLTAEERRQSAERAASKNANTVKRAARIAAASTY